MSELSYMQWCLQRLTTTQYVVYLAIKNLGLIATTRQKITDICGLTSVSWHIKSLEKLGFVQIESGRNGLKILWIRQSSDESAPEKKEREKISLIAPDGNTFAVKKGEFRKFCHNHNLSPASFSQVVNGRVKTHRGWRLA